jgi:hypothetical protein
MEITKKQIIGTIFTIILALIINLFIELDTIYKIISIIILIAIIILIFISGIFRKKIHDFSETRRIKKIVINDINLIKNGKEASINLHDLDHVISHRNKFEKIEDLDILFEDRIKRDKLFANNIKKIIEDKKKREAEYYRKLFEKVNKL